MSSHGCLYYKQLPVILNVGNNPYDTYCFHYEDPGVRITVMLHFWS